MNGNPSPTINPRRLGNSLHYSRPEIYFDRASGRGLSRTQMPIRAAVSATNEE
jgi:hypothetical protein